MKHLDHPISMTPIGAFFAPSDLHCFGGWGLSFHFILSKILAFSPLFSFILHRNQTHTGKKKLTRVEFIKWFFVSVSDEIVTIEERVKSHVLTEISSGNICFHPHKELSSVTATRTHNFSSNFISLLLRLLNFLPV